MLQGARGTLSWQQFNPDTGLWEGGVGTVRPTNWREGILYLYPNGKVTLTGLTSQMKSDKVDDPRYHWWEQIFPLQGGDITLIAAGPPPLGGVYTDPAMTIPYVGGGVLGTQLYINVDENVALHFRAGHQALLRSSIDPFLDVNAKVTSMLPAGVNSQISVSLLEPDDNSIAGNTLANADRILVNGNINPEGSAQPPNLAYDPTAYWNYTQIFRTPLEITRTARRTRLRTGDAYMTMKREALELHAVEIEKAFFWGTRTRVIGANGQPERTTMGLIPYIREYSGFISDYADPANTPFDGVPAGTDFTTGGGDWLDWCISEIFRYGSNDRIAFAGQGAVLALNRYVKAHGSSSFTLTTATVAWGIKVTQWVTPFGTINILTHPLFSYEPTNSYTMVVFDFEDLRYRFIDDTEFFPDKEKMNTGHNRVDGTKEDWLTEAGLELHHPEKMAYLVGFNNIRL